MKKYLILLFLTLCFSNVGVKSQEIEVVISDKEILNYSCFNQWYNKDKIDYCFCKRNSDNSVYSSSDQTCGTEKYNNSKISYGEYLQLGGDIKHFDNWKKTDVSSSINVSKDHFLNFESEIVKRTFVEYKFINPSRNNNNLNKNKLVFACKGYGVYLLLVNDSSKCVGSDIKISKEEYFEIEMKYCKTGSHLCNDIGRSLVQSPTSSEQVSQKDKVFYCVDGMARKKTKNTIGCFKNYKEVTKKRYFSLANLKEVTNIQSTKVAQSQTSSKQFGCIKGNCINGFGTFATPGGIKYVGEHKNGKLYGQGTITFPDGAKYVGEYKDDKKHGQGKFIDEHGNKYVGEYKDDKRHGQGTLTFVSGDKYVGEWKNNIKHGQGTYSYASGSKYVGEYKDGKGNGQGRYTYADGNEYVGSYKDNKRHGQGTATYTNGDVENGIWKNNEFVEPNNIKIISETKVAQSQTSSEQVSQETEVVQTKLDKKSLKEELQYWKELFQDELITQAEYDAKRKELLSGATITKKVITKKKESAPKIVSKKKVNDSFLSKNYIFPKLNKGLFGLSWTLPKIVKNCSSRYSDILESTECSKDNLKETKYYKKNRSEKMQLYKVFVTYADNIIQSTLNGQINKSQASMDMAKLESEIFREMDKINNENAEYWNNFSQNMLAPGNESFMERLSGIKREPLPENNSGLNGITTCNFTQTVKGNSTNLGTMTCQ